MPEDILAQSDAPASDQLDAIAELVQGCTVAVLTGAGLSTDSGIPDYRGEGAPVRTPMQFAEFLSSERQRQRYWAGSHLGWQRFTNVHPNRGHRALARLEHGGVINGVITQNVDGLHVAAGSTRVVDLHGSMNRVLCLSCGQLFARDAIATALEAHNPWISHPETVELGPDGDVVPERLDGFVTPACSVCGGILKPDVVFFGEFVPTKRFAEARTIVENADALLIAGSSLAVNSGIRILEIAVRRELPIIIVNRGATKGDTRATIKLDAGATPTLDALAERLLP